MQVCFLQDSEKTATMPVNNDAIGNCQDQQAEGGKYFKVPLYLSGHEGFSFCCGFCRWLQIAFKNIAYVATLGSCRDRPQYSAG